MKEFSIQRRIEFADTDMGGIVHFSRFFVFMETAEHEFLAAAGTCVHHEADGRTISWPRVSATCDYKSPARFGDVLDIHVRVVRKGKSSMTYGFRIRVGEREVAEGRMTSVCCELLPDRTVRSVPIPGYLADAIEEAPAE